MIEKDNSLREDLKLPADAELNAELQKCWNENNEHGQVFFTVLNACGESKFVSCRYKGAESL